MSSDWKQAFADPIVLQAEKILSQRQTRNLVIDPDLLGEPGWDIILSAFIATGKSKICTAGSLATDLDLSLSVVNRWINLLTERDMIQVDGLKVSISPNADGKLRKMFGAQMQALFKELNGISGALHAANSDVPYAE